jgi:hypothetical protein
MLLINVRILVRMKYEPGLLNKFDRLRLYQLPLEVWWVLLVDLRSRKTRKGCSGTLFELAFASPGCIIHLYIAS